MLAFVCTALILSLVQLSSISYNYNFQKTILLERISGIHENVKETSKELLRQGASLGFTVYDKSHKIGDCIHCDDYDCLPPAEIPPPNVCDKIACSDCFREKDAKEAAKTSALLTFQQITIHKFDPDFSSTIGEPNIEITTKIYPTGENGISIDYIKFTKGLDIFIHSDKFNISADGEIPGGAIIESSGNN